MRNTLYLVTLAAAAIVLVAANAQQQIVKINSISGISVSDGKQMLVNSCAPCHGVNGQGNGPVASSLKQRPADLTILSRDNGGKFPYVHIHAILEFGATNPAHGTSLMPVWRPIFSQVDPETTQNADRLLRMNNVIRYVASIQIQ